MKTIQVHLEPNNAILSGLCYEREMVLPNSDARPAVLVLGGGGYIHITAKERDPIAMAYLHYGFNAFVLHYSVRSDSKGSPKASDETVLQDSFDDVTSAMKYLRDNAAELNINPNQIAIVGFSAGGNLALRYSTQSKNKPNALVLCYPAVQSSMFGNQPNVLEQMDDSFPASFIFHTLCDSMVPSRQALELALKLDDLKVPYEMHTFLTGDHGLAMAIENTGDVNRDVAKWHKLSVRFLQNLYSGKNLLWADLADAKPSVKMRNDILASKEKTKAIVAEYAPQLIEHMTENPFFASITLERLAQMLGVDSSVVEKIQKKLAALD